MKNRARLARYVMHEGEFIMCREVETRGVVCAARCANPEHSRPICLFGFERVFRRYCDIEMSSSSRVYETSEGCRKGIHEGEVM